MTSDHCPVCGRPISEHPDGLACCPFCGAREVAIIRTGSGRHSSIVSCLMCHGGLEANETESTTGSAWNSRAPHAETERLRAENEALRQRVANLNRYQILGELPTVCRAFASLSDNPKGPAHD